MAEPTPLAKQESFFKGAPLRFDNKTGLLKRTKSRRKVKSNINGLCDKPLDKLPVSKDLPRLARNFEVFIPDEESPRGIQRVQSFKEVKDWKAKTEHEFERDPDDDNEIPKHVLLYQLLQVMTQNLPKRDLETIFPSFKEYEQTVNLDDPTSLNHFLLEKFGEEHEVTRLLKVCHQSVIVNILLNATQALSKHHIKFKDVRGAWRIQVHVPAAAQNNSPRLDNEQIEIDAESEETDPYLLDLERLKSRYISLGHRRREQVFVTFSEWKKQQEALTGEPMSPSKNNPAMKQLFQFEWEVRIFFDPITFAMVDVTVQLLNINYNNEDGSKSQERDCAVQRNALIDFFQQYVTQDEDDDEEEDEKIASPSKNASPVIKSTTTSNASTPASPSSEPSETTALQPNGNNTRTLGFTNILFRLLCWRRRPSQI